MFEIEIRMIPTKYLNQITKLVRKRKKQKQKNKTKTKKRKKRKKKKRRKKINDQLFSSVYLWSGYHIDSFNYLRDCSPLRSSYELKLA